jgi:hypothetical protein
VPTRESGERRIVAVKGPKRLNPAQPSVVENSLSVGKFNETERAAL